MLNNCNLEWKTKSVDGGDFWALEHGQNGPKTAQKVPFFALCQIWGQFAAKELMGFFKILTRDSPIRCIKTLYGDHYIGHQFWQQPSSVSGCYSFAQN